MVVYHGTLIFSICSCVFSVARNKWIMYCNFPLTKNFHCSPDTWSHPLDLFLYRQGRPHHRLCYLHSRWVLWHKPGHPPTIGPPQLPFRERGGIRGCRKGKGYRVGSEAKLRKEIGRSGAAQGWRGAKSKENGEKKKSCLT